jgi:hypothetical protein
MFSSCSQVYVLGTCAAVVAAAVAQKQTQQSHAVAMFLVGTHLHH